ncbi:response regulator [uncultured Enterovirga sp.]|uniref:response regulator n=1 Tax=uncultured Enterovirga sp. TaxID=2026352 RepID=UPI0035CA0849
MLDRATRRPMTALIAEDDAGQSALGAMMLREFDLEVDEVRSAEEAIECLCNRSGQVTLLIADIHLSGAMDGIALAHRVSVLWPGVSVIVTSGRPGMCPSDLPARATYIPKPWRALDIVAVAERASRADHTLRAVRL